MPLPAGDLTLLVLTLPASGIAPRLLPLPLLTLPAGDLTLLVLTLPASGIPLRLLKLRPLPLEHIGIAP